MSGSPSVPLPGDQPALSSGKRTPAAEPGKPGDQKGQAPFPDPARLFDKALPEGQSVARRPSGPSLPSGTALVPAGPDGEAALLRLGAEALTADGEGDIPTPRDGDQAPQPASPNLQNPRGVRSPGDASWTVGVLPGFGTEDSATFGAGERTRQLSPGAEQSAQSSLRALGGASETGLTKVPTDGEPLDPAHYRTKGEIPLSKNRSAGARGVELPGTPGLQLGTEQRNFEEVSRAVLDGATEAEIAALKLQYGARGVTGTPANTLSDAVRALAAILPGATEVRDAGPLEATPANEAAKAKKQPHAWSRQTPAMLKNGAVTHNHVNAAEPKPTVVRVETHLPPVRPLETTARGALPVAEISPQTNTPSSPAAEQRTTFQTIAPQIREALSAALNDPALAPETGRSPAEAQKLRPLVRVVEISLHPASLGAVAVTLRLTGAGLRINVTAETRETADALRDDTDALEALVRTAGYDPESVTVTHRPK